MDSRDVEDGDGVCNDPASSNSSKRLKQIENVKMKKYVIT